MPERSVEITDHGSLNAHWYTLRLYEDGEVTRERQISKQELYADPKLGQFGGRLLEDLGRDPLFVEAAFGESS